MVMIIMITYFCPFYNVYMCVSFGVYPGGALSVGALAAGARADAPLPLAVAGPVQRMDPLNNLQVYTYTFLFIA